MTNPEDQFQICDKRSAILNGDGHMLVVGGPGAGKTTIALLKARRSVLERLQPEQSVLFLSFSNAAIRRILEGAGNLLTQEIERQVDIMTYHSFAWDILRSHGYLLSSQRQLSIVAAHDAAAIRAGMDDEDWAAEEKRLFLEEGRATYDQFAPRAAELLERSNVIRRRFSSAHPLILADEFQDSDEDQWRIIRTLAEDSEVVVLGDAEQRIYEWRRGVSATRLQDFADALNATRHDFRNENNRSPTAGIAGYARSLLSPKVRLPPPAEISFTRCEPWKFKPYLRTALNRTVNETAKRAKRRDLSLAIAARSRPLVRIISDALSKELTIGTKAHAPVRHDVMFDHEQTALAARVVAHVMASKADPPNERLAGALERIGAVYRSTGKKTAIKKSDQLARWADQCRVGKAPKTKCVTTLTAVFNAIDETGFSGSPREDWLLARQMLERSDAEELQQTGDHARFLRILRRGSEIESQLTELWKRRGSYAGAEAAADAALQHAQLADSHREASGICVMTMHQLKGREYDAVLLVEDQYRSFLGRDNEPPFMETRRLLQVSLTRARHFACILSATSNPTLNAIFEG